MHVCISDCVCWPWHHVQVYCASDLHVDAPGAEALAWLRSISTTRFQQDVIIVAGEAAYMYVHGAVQCLHDCAWYSAVSLHVAD